ncbi:NusB antitermination factor [Lishizhenia tianjinensis]|uniref:NusB antitermination factor n=1 Tax=Lishizhenia tianjinensis TaxID=477690 RepID=A0A1I6YG01_9FLAO|nr:transcription antitermination protein NusB [Lishizhenia tianjinensis]SFT49475.1 NusB antitermination factor [Lishizhenia tianjinensis]
MLNRRHLRIKVLQSLYAYYQSDKESVIRAEKEMMEAIDRIYDLYLYFLLGFAELKNVAEHRIEENKKKILPKEEDLNPNMKFVENKVIAMLEDNYMLIQASEERTVNWVGDTEREIFRKMFLHIRESETFFEFMNNGNTGFEEDKNFLIALFKTEIANFDHLYSFFEEKSIHWLDDIDLAATMVIKTLKGFEEEGANDIMPLYKDPIDEKDFVRTLLKKTIKREEENLKLIDELTSNWELDRIARMDVLLMEMAITELQEFNNIPVKVTLNEYIEISKFYSTPKSNVFINGVLDKAIARLEADGQINKIGRGLMN